jgi:hypothetical protein
LAEQAHKKEQQQKQQQQSQKNKKKKKKKTPAKSNDSTQVKTENGTTNVTGDGDNIRNLKKVAPKHHTCNHSKPVRKGTYLNPFNSFHVFRSQTFTRP